VYICVVLLCAGMNMRRYMGTHICTCVCIGACMPACICVCVYMHVFVCMHVWMHTWMLVCARTCFRVCLYLFTCVCTHAFFVSDAFCMPKLSPIMLLYLVIHFCVFSTWTDLYYGKCLQFNDSL